MRLQINAHSGEIWSHWKNVFFERRTASDFVDASKPDAINIKT